MGLPEMLHLSGMWKAVPWSWGTAVLAVGETRGTLSLPGGAAGTRGRASGVRGSQFAGDSFRSMWPDVPGG